MLIGEFRNFAWNAVARSLPHVVNFPKKANKLIKIEASLMETSAEIIN